MIGEMGVCRVSKPCGENYRSATNFVAFDRSNTNGRNFDRSNTNARTKMTDLRVTQFHLTVLIVTLVKK